MFVKNILNQRLFSYPPLGNALSTFSILTEILCITAINVGDKNLSSSNCHSPKRS